MTQIEEAHEAYRELLIKLRADCREAEKRRDTAKAEARDCKLMIMKLGLDMLVARYRVESAPHLILLPVLKTLYRDAALQGQIEGNSLDLKFQLHNMLSWLVLPAERRTEECIYEREHLSGGFVIIEETALRKVISTTWLLDMEDGKTAPPRLSLSWNVPLIRKFKEETWGVLFPELVHASARTASHIDYSFWLMNSKFLAVKKALELVSQTPAPLSRYDVSGCEVGMPGLPVQNLFF